MKVRNVKVNSLASVFTDSTLSTFTQNAINKGVTDDSIIYIVCGSSDAATYGSQYAEGSHWIWAKGEMFAGNNMFSESYNDIDVINIIEGNNNVIIYQSDSGNIITPNNMPGIISNTYYEDYGAMIFDKEVTCIGFRAFESSDLTSIIIPNSVTVIERYAFYECQYLTSITLPPNVKYFGFDALYECSNLEEIICLPIVPPINTDDGMDGTNDCSIYVPAESVDAYKTAPGWDEDVDRIEELEL